MEFCRSFHCASTFSSLRIFFVRTDPFPSHLRGDRDFCCDPHSLHCFGASPILPFWLRHSGVPQACARIPVETSDVSSSNGWFFQGKTSATPYLETCPHVRDQVLTNVEEISPTPNCTCFHCDCPTLVPSSNGSLTPWCHPRSGRSPSPHGHPRLLKVDSGVGLLRAWQYRIGYVRRRLPCLPFFTSVVCGPPQFETPG